MMQKVILNGKALRTEIYPIVFFLGLII